MTAPTLDLMPGPHDPPITVDEMVERGKLVSVEQATQWLASTEPLGYRNFETGEHVSFRVPDSWDPEWFAAQHGTVLLPVFMSLPGESSSSPEEYQLTKDAVLEAAKHMPGISSSFVANAPNFLVEDAYNHWFRSGALDRQLQLMTVGEIGQAIVRESLVPFSNLELLDRAVAAIEEKFPGTAIYADATKFSHSLRETFLQLVIPEMSRIMTGTGEVDDRWWGGLQFSNSLAGETQTGVDGFLFRQRCTNGMIERSGSASSWSRRGSGGNSAEDAYNWARVAVDEVLGGLESSFDKVQALTEQDIEGEVGSTVRDVFEAHRIPNRARERIMSYLVENDQLNMYALTNAVTMAANTADSPREQQQLMRAGGEVVEHGDRCGECHRLVME